MSASITQDAGREWFGAVRQASSVSRTRLNFSSTVHRQFAGDPVLPTRSHSLRRIGTQHPQFFRLDSDPIDGDKTAVVALCKQLRSDFVRYRRPDQLINIVNRLDICSGTLIAPPN